jgi:hypothetical protein
VIRNLKILEFLPPEADTDVIITALNSAIANSTENGEGSSLNFTRLNQVVHTYTAYDARYAVEIVYLSS